MPAIPQFWVVVPAAGGGRRMGMSVPKQYLSLCGRSVIERALEPFLARSECRGIVVAIADDDRYWRELVVAKEPRVRTVGGGAERIDSVRAGVQALPARPDDWVLVHDAARPCLSGEDLVKLLETLREDDVGGLLAAPVVDTLKREDADGRVQATVDRTGLWHALTPQMFRYGILSRALQSAASGTDESQAVEALGLKPRLVRGSAENIKITMAEDLARAERILKARSES
jgi:2-C-methyl-D-erythritol 4-phosphate cytidylyltransferase